VKTSLLLLVKSSIPSHAFAARIAPVIDADLRYFLRQPLSRLGSTMPLGGGDQK